MSDNDAPQIKYDVFVSFSAEIRRRFLSHLVEAFKSKKINVFVEDLLERGDKVWPSLVGAIEGSSISLVIFSPNYASSHWCLEELVAILKCQEKYGQFVIPIFYKVEPMDVRYQSSHRYKNAFDTHERKHNSKVQIWRDALNKSAILSGIESSKFQNGAELLEEIVNLVQVVLTRLDNSKGFVGSSNPKEFVGIGRKVDDVELLMYKERKDTHLTGIRSIGSVGFWGVEEETMLVKNAPQIKYDVFISFRGKDTRFPFCRNLIDTFQRNNINAFVDYEILERGKEIWASLVKAIEESSISLIIFSPHYASSSRCLEELVTILECRQKYGRIVIPVFYKVQPTDVGHQSSQSYKTAFANHETKYESKKVQIWRDALKISTKIYGIVSSIFWDDDELHKEIVKLVLARLGTQLVNSKRLVGIDKKIEELESLICKEAESTRLIGIWGMGGIGKTTLAKEVFNKLRLKFQGSCFLTNEREQSSKYGRITFKEEIFAKLLGHDVKIDAPNSLPNERVRRMKILIVLEDVNDSGHLEELLDTLDDFGSGSRIMITTRNEPVLNANEAADVYQLGELNFDEALKLFKLNAFNSGDHQSEYDELSERMVNYAKGIPLVLKVLARLLRGKNKEVWVSELNKLNKMSLRIVHDIMKLSYDDLDCKEQQIFLDLSCFFLRSRTNIKADYLKLLLRDDENDNSVVVGLERLKDKALITVSEDNFVSTHDCLREMACEIVRRESTEKPEKRSRFWNFDEIDQVLINDKIAGTDSIHYQKKGIESIRSILLHLPKIKKRKPRHLIFAKMSKLRFLEVNDADYIFGCLDQLDNQDTNPYWHEHQKAWTVEVSKILATDELRFLNVNGYPLNSLPENFSGKELVILKLQFGAMKKLWNGAKNLVNLKELDLSYSEKLEELPDFSKSINLEVLILYGCSKLTSVHRSVFYLPKLVTLDLSYCMSLTVLTSNSHFCSLSYLNVYECNNLTEFSVISKNMEELKLIDMKFKALPSSFGDQSKLKLLRIERSEIERLPSSFRNLMQLQHLELINCKMLQTLPKLPMSLKTLNACSCNGLLTIPELPPSLETLDVSNCDSLQTLPELPLSLETLKVCGLDSLITLSRLPSSLETLDVSYCDSLLTLPELPLSLETLKVHDCNSLMTLPGLPSSLEILVVSNCISLLTLPELPSSLETLDVSYCDSLLTLPELPLSLETLKVYNCDSLMTLLGLPSSLEILVVSNCISVLTLPELPSSLETLDVSYCDSLLTLPELPLSLETLKVSGCNSLMTLSELPSSLETLVVSYCNSLQTLPELPPSLKILHVSYCDSFLTLPKLSVSLETLYMVGFRNWLKLDKKSQADIGLNAQINLMKYADQHLSTPNHHHHQNYESDPAYQAVYKYPGRSVPEWLEYKTTNDYIIMDLSSTPPSSRLGFIFCFVIDPTLYYIWQHRLRITISFGAGESIGESFQMFLKEFSKVQSSNEVCVVYDQRCSDFLYCRAKNQTSFKIQVKASLAVIRQFGVSPINSSTYESFKQQMRLRDSL